MNHLNFHLPLGQRGMNQRAKIYVLEMLDLHTISRHWIPFISGKSPFYFLRKRIHMLPDVWISSTSF